MAVTNIGQANIVIRAVTAGFKEDVEKALKDVKPVVEKIGKDVGKDFNRSVSRGMGGSGKGPFDKIAKEAEQARSAFNKLIKTGYLLGPAIAGAVSAVGDLVLGLFAVGSAVGAAAPALAVLPGLLAAVAQGALTAKLAFGGVTKGIGGLLKQKTGKSAGGANNDNAIADARKRLAQVYQDAAEKMASANDKVRKAQIALNQAYKDGAESLQQLGFDAEDAALAQSKAAIELERARESLLRTQDVPVDSRARREAEIAFKEADLNYRQAVDRSNDIAKAQEYAAKTGIEGTKEVLSAKQDLSQAEVDRVKTERDNTQAILEAQLALQRALQKTNQNSAASVDLLKDLSAEAKRFAIYIASLKPEFLKLRSAAGEKLFGPLTVAVDMLVTRLFPVLIPIVRTMGGVVGNIARKFAEMLTRVDNLDIIKRVFGGANIGIMRNLGDAFVDVAEAALNILDAVSPLTVQFSEFIKKSADALVGVVRFKNATGELNTSFQKAADFAKSIGGLLSSAFGAFKSLGGGASDAGKKIIDAFSGAFDKLKAFSDEGKRTGALQAKFNAIADNVIAIGGFLGEVAKMFYQISGNKGVMAFFNAIKPIPGIFASIFTQMTSTGPIFGELLVNVALLLKAFTDTGGITYFFKVLNEALKVVIAIFNNEIIQKVFLFLAAVKGITLAFGLLLTVLRFTGLALLGNVIGARGLTGGLSSVSASARKATYELRAMNKTGGLGPGIMSSLTRARVSFMMLGREIKKTVILTLESTLSNLRNAASWLFSSASITFFKLALKSATAGVYQMTTALSLQAIAFAMTPVGLFVIALAALVGLFVAAYMNSEKLRKAISNMGKVLMGSLGEAFKTIKDALGGVIPAFGNLSDVMKALGDWIAKYIIPVFTKVIQFGIKLFTVYILGMIESIKAAVAVFKIIFDLILIFPRAIYDAATSGEDFGVTLVNALKTAGINILNTMIDLVNGIIRAFNVLSPKDLPLIPLFEDTKKVTEELTTSTKPLTDAQEAVKRKMEEAAGAASGLYTKFGDLKTIQATVRTEIENTFDKVTEGARSLITARDAAKAFKEQTDSLATSMKDGSLSQDQKKDSLYAYSASVLDAIKKDIELGGTQESTTKILNTGKDAFLKAAENAGIFGTEATNLATSLGLTPSTITKTFKASGLGDLQQMVKDLEALEVVAGNANSKEGRGNFSSTQLINLKAEVSTKMFGLGQNKGQPLFVEVTNSTLTPPKKAVGGPISANKTYLVGEKGPELFSSNSAGKITPNGQLGSMSGGSAPTIIVNPSQGMDEREIANLVSRRLAFMQRGV